MKRTEILDQYYMNQSKDVYPISIFGELSLLGWICFYGEFIQNVRKMINIGVVTLKFG